MTFVLDAEKSYSPLSAWDEYPIHQSVAPIRYVSTSDPRAFERYWFTAQARDGSAFLITGMGVYPNLGVTDAYALLVYQQRQITLRAHQPLSADRAALQVGPLRFAPTRPFVEWSLSLAPGNELGFSFDLRWFDTKRPRFGQLDFSKLPGAAENVHLMHDWGGYESFGAIEGEIRLGDSVITLTRDKFVGSRDHHWGIRDGVGGINLQPPKKSYGHAVPFVEFRDWAMWGVQVLYNVGDTAAPMFAEPVSHEIGFDPTTRHFKEAILTYRLGNGQLKRLHFKAIEDMTAYLRCGGYAGPDGRGSPLGDYYHGLATGPSLVADTRDVSDPQTRIDIAGFEDVLCVVTCDGEVTVGIFECMNPALYEMCKAGKPGFSFLSGGDPS